MSEVTQPLPKVGNRVKLKIKQVLNIISVPPMPGEANDILPQAACAEKPKSNDVFGRSARSHPMEGCTCELLIDDKPVAKIIQAISFSFDAQTETPLLTLSIVPSQLDIEIDADMLVNEQLVPIYCINDSSIRSGKSIPADKVAELLGNYRKEFPAPVDG